MMFWRTSRNLREEKTGRSRAGVHVRHRDNRKQKGTEIISKDLDSSPLAAFQRKIESFSWKPLNKLQFNFASCPQMGLTVFSRAGTLPEAWPPSVWRRTP